MRPWAIRVFERQWLVNAILFGNYVRLRDKALELLGAKLPGRTLQVACVYGDMTNRLVSAYRRAMDGSTSWTSCPGRSRICAASCRRTPMSAGW